MQFEIEIASPSEREESRMPTAKVGDISIYDEIHGEGEYSGGWRRAKQRPPPGPGATAGPG